MGQTIAQKIIAAHLVSGEMKAGAEIALKIDQTLTQDATGTMAYLEFESMGIDRVRTEKSVAYVDHNTLQTGFENPDDHRFIQTAAKKHGIYFSRPGNGICHQVHLERFGIPGKTLIVRTAIRRRRRAGYAGVRRGRHGRRRRDGRRSLLYHDAQNVESKSDGKASSVCHGEGRQPGNPPPAFRQGRRRIHCRMGRRGRQDPDRARTGDDYQHGRGARRNHFDFSLRRSDGTIFGRSRAAEGFRGFAKRSRRGI